MVKSFFMMNLIFICYLIVQVQRTRTYYEWCSSPKSLGHFFYCMFSNNKALYGAEMGQCQINFKCYWEFVSTVATDQWYLLENGKKS